MSGVKLDLRGPKRSSVYKGLQRHHPRKGKPVVRLGRKTKGPGAVTERKLRDANGSLVAERMLAAAVIDVRIGAAAIRMVPSPTRG